MTGLVAQSFRPLLVCSKNGLHGRSSTVSNLLQSRVVNLQIRSQSSRWYRTGLPLIFLHRSGQNHARSFHTLRPLDEQSKRTDPVAKQPAKPLVVPSLIPHENIWTIPNILTFSRLAAAPVIGYMLLHDQHIWAFSLFVYAGVTDLVDGWIARRFNQGTVVGTVIDPMADKTLMTIVTVTLAANGAMPVYLAVLILGRDVLLAISAIYYRYISLPPPKTFSRYWDFSLPSAEVRPTGISKVNTALQLGLIGATMGMPLVEFGAWATTALTGFQYLVAVTTVWSGASYVYSKDAVKILSQPQQDRNGADQDKQTEGRKRE